MIIVVFVYYFEDFIIVVSNWFYCLCRVWRRGFLEGIFMSDDIGNELYGIISFV